MQNIWLWLQGKKTYVVALAGIIYLVVIEGWQNNNWKWEEIWALVLIMTGRSALKKGS